MLTQVYNTRKLRHTSLNKGSTVSSCITHSSGQFCATILSIHLPPSGQTASLNHIFVLYNPNTGFEHPNTPAFAFFSTAGGVASYVYRQIQTKQTLRSPDRTTSGSYNFRIYTHSTTNPTLPQTFIDDTLVPITPCNQYMLSDDPWQAVFTELRDRGRDKRSSSSSADSLRQSLAAQRDLLDYILFSRFLHLPSSNTNPADTDIPPPVPPKRPIPSGPPFKCPICLDDEPGSNAIEIVGCGHKFGIGCLRLLVKSALRDKKFPVVCPSCSVEDERSDGVVGSGCFFRSREIRWADIAMATVITSHTAQKIGISSKEFAFCEELELASVAVALHCTKYDFTLFFAFSASAGGFPPSWGWFFRFGARCGRTAHVDRDDYHAQMDCLAEIPVEEPRKRKRQVIAAWLKKKWVLFPSLHPKPPFHRNKKYRLWKTDKTKKFEVPDECSIQRCVFPECDHLWCKHCSQTLLENTPHTCDGTAELARWVWGCRRRRWWSMHGWLKFWRLMATEGWKNCPGAYGSCVSSTIRRGLN
jgi:hypothetical protein